MGQETSSMEKGACSMDQKPSSVDQETGSVDQETEFTADTEIFGLFPRNSAARKIVRSNPQCAAGAEDDDEYLSFKAGQKSRTEGGVFASFGCADDNDIILDKKYADYQCSFFLSGSGELLLEDHSNEASSLLVKERSSGEYPGKYALQGSPRRRVIPRDDDFKVTVGLRGARFAFHWFHVSNAARTVLQQCAAANGRSPVPGPLTERRRRMRTPFDSGMSDVAGILSGNAEIEYHCYEKLDEGPLGVVHLVADLSNGDLWAMKTCTWEGSLKQDLDTAARLRHRSIPRVEHIQGLGSHEPSRLFFKPYRPMRELLASHSCTRPKPRVVTWLSAFIDQVLSGLECMHAHGIEHKRITVDNLAYVPGSEGKMEFVITGFGPFSCHNDPIGPGSSPSKALKFNFLGGTDAYSFGLVFLEVLGIYCPLEGDERTFPVRRWQRKLKRLGFLDSMSYVDDSEWGTTHSRVTKLDALLPAVIFSHFRGLGADYIREILMDRLAGKREPECPEKRFVYS